MKKWMVALLAALALWNPTKGTDVGKLIPVELVQILRTERGFVVRTDTENKGVGETLSSAFADLEEKASGKVFLETAEYVLLTENTKACVGELEAYFRPGTQVYQTPPLEDLTAAAEYLGQHRVPSPLFRRKTPLPRLIQREGELAFASGKEE